MQKTHPPAPKTLTDALNTLCALLLRQSPMSDDLIIELHPYAEEISGIKEADLSAHARLEMGRLFAIIGEELRAIPGIERISPAFRFHTYGADYSEISILLGNDFVWSASFKNVDAILAELVSKFEAVFSHYPDGPVNTYLVSGDGTGIFADDREYKVRASSSEEAVALFSLMSRRRAEDGLHSNIKDVRIIHLDAQ